jgi:hypothetical protein
VPTDRTTAQSITRVLLITSLILAIPLVANQFITGEGWSLFDFAFAGGLIMGTGLAYELAVKRPGSRTSAVITPLVAAVGGAAIPLGEIDDAPGLILMGLALIFTAVVMGLKGAGVRARAA